LKLAANGPPPPGAKLAAELEKDKFDARRPPLRIEIVLAELLAGNYFLEK